MLTAIANNIAAADEPNCASLYRHLPLGEQDLLRAPKYNNR